MATIKDLHISISNMSKDELEKRLLEIRKNIREPKKEFKVASNKPAKSKAKVEKPLDLKAMFAIMSDEEKSVFLSSIEGE